MNLKSLKAITYFLFLICITVFLFSLKSYAQEIIINSNETWPAGNYSYDSITINNNATLTLESNPATDEGVTLNVTDLIIDSGASISADGKGYAGGGGADGQGPGGGIFGGGRTGSGGGYGGNGGNSIENDIGGESYGSSTEPTDLGSGGGGHFGGGSGGGAIRLNVLGNLTVDGTISANGTNGGYDPNWCSYGTGGGSGGSIYITTGTLTGTGIINANGGRGNDPIRGCGYGGGGGGGRIAIYYTTNNFNGIIGAHGGEGYQNGEDGTVGLFDSTNNILTVNTSYRFKGSTEPGAEPVEYYYDTIQLTDGSKTSIIGNVSIAANNLIIENGSSFTLEGSSTTLTINSPIFISNNSSFVFTGSQTLTSPSLNIAEGSTLSLSGTEIINLNVIRVTGQGSVITHSSGNKVYLTVTDLIIDSGASISADGKGYAGGGGADGQGPGGGIFGGGRTGSGGGYGGNGGNSIENDIGGESYGSSTEPTDLGSGGGGHFGGGSGGGAIRLNVLGNLTVDGTISANGTNGGYDPNWCSYGTGGGSGGSIYITTGTLTGTGIINANGGRGNDPIRGCGYGGGGGGGRIAIYYTTNNFNGIIGAHGGEGYQNGEDGTFYLSDLRPVVGENIQISSNNQFAVEEYTQGEYLLQLENNGSNSHAATLAILNNDPNLLATLGQDYIILSPGESVTLPVYVDASSAPPGTYDIQIEIIGDDGSIVYSNIRIYVTDQVAGDFADLELISEDIYFSNVNPLPDDNILISARINNKGTSVADNISVKFFEFGTLVEEVVIDAIPANSSRVASVFASFPYAGEQLIRVVVDQADQIQELDENNNEASQILQVGYMPELSGDILVTGHMPSTIIEGTSFTVTGRAVYEIFVDGVRNINYVVKGGSVKITVIEDGGEGQEWVYSDIYTDISGNFSKVLRAPDVLGVYHVIMTVTDKTFEGYREMPFEVVSQPPPTPPSPPTTSGSGSWLPSGGGSYTWVWTSHPVHEPVPVSDIYVHSEDIYFSSFNPSPGEEISIVADIHFWSNSTSNVAFNVPVNFYVTYPGNPKMKIGDTVIPIVTVGEPDYGISRVFASWKNYAEGIYIVEIEIDPYYEEENKLNNAATRAILVGQLENEHGAVSGQVTDPWGTVSGVTIWLNNSSGTFASTVTDETGSYLFTDILPGDYDVQIIVPDGYQTDSEFKPTQVDPNSISEVDFHITIADDKGPITADLSTDLNPVQISDTVYLTAFVDDTSTGNSNIKSAEYSLDGVTWIEMDPQDGAFDSPSEAVELTLTVPVIPGVYELCARGTDSYDNVGPEECMFLVTYDPEGGFVTGGGWIWSPIGAYTDNPPLEGKANFGFVSKYKKGATVPTGQTEFQFKVADLNFHSNSYDWLVIAGAKSQYKGIGTTNGEGEYNFMISAVDSDVIDTDNFETDRFRIKIWYEIDDTEYVVYDNALGSEEVESMTDIGGGSIVIHKK